MAGGVSSKKLLFYLAGIMNLHKITTIMPTVVVPIPRKDARYSREANFKAGIAGTLTPQMTVSS